MKRKLPPIQFLVAAWATIIFSTSCFFIERQVFIDFVKQFIPVGVPRHLWINFWGGFGIFVVKAYHVAEYALLCYLLYVLLRKRFAPQRALQSGAALALIFAASDEWHQTYVPGRGGTWVDVVIDSLGIGLAAICIVRSLKTNG